MHTWGDDWPYWDELNQVVHRCCELVIDAGLSGLQIKEKYGTLRYYCLEPTTSQDKESYRSIYATLIDEFPHLATEILANADWFRECLVGIIAESDCEHKAVWKNDREQWCGVCGKIMEA